MIEREQLSFPNQIKPDRSDSWAIVFGAPKGTLFLHTLFTTRQMVNQDRIERLRSAWRSAVGTTGKPHERLSRAARERLRSAE